MRKPSNVEEEPIKSEYMESESTAVNFSQSAVAKDANGARYVAQPFRFPDGGKGMAIIMRLEDKEWDGNVSSVEITYED